MTQRKAVALIAAVLVSVSAETTMLARSHPRPIRTPDQPPPTVPIVKPRKQARGICASGRMDGSGYRLLA